MLAVCFGCPLWTVTMFCSCEVCPVQLRHACVQLRVKRNLPQGDNKGILWHIVSQLCSVSRCQHKLTNTIQKMLATLRLLQVFYSCLLLAQTCNIQSESFPHYHLVYSDMSHISLAQSAFWSFTARKKDVCPHHVFKTSKCGKIKVK